MIPTWIRLFFRKGHPRPRTKPDPAGPAAIRDTEDPVTHETPSTTGRSPAEVPLSSDPTPAAPSAAVAPAAPTGSDHPCPACGDGVAVAGDVELGEVLYCAHCGAELEVIQREPLLLDLFEEEEK